MIGSNDDQQRFLMCYGAVNVLRAANRAPGADAIAILVQSAKYGGAGLAWAVSSTSAGFARVLVHEVGHSFGGLWDEYDYDSGLRNLAPIGLAPNLSTSASPGDLPWRHLVAPGTALPTMTPEQGVGAYRLANTRRPVYRPASRCLMRDDRDPYCAVCSERLAARIARHAGAAAAPPPTWFARIETARGERYVEWEPVSTIQAVDSYRVDLRNGRTGAIRTVSTREPRIRLDPALAAAGDRLTLQVTSRGPGGSGTSTGFSFAVGESTLARISIDAAEDPLRPWIGLHDAGGAPKDVRVETATGLRLHEASGMVRSWFRWPIALTPGERYAFWFRDPTRPGSDWVGVFYHAP